MTQDELKQAVARDARVHPSLCGPGGNGLRLYSLRDR
jgi:hypothetical protein